VDTELRHLDRDAEWVFLPDISVTLAGRLTVPPADDDSIVEVPPDFVIEVLSPDDRPGRVGQRIAYYMRAGVRLLWVVDPAAEEVTVCEPGAAPRIVASPAVLSAEPVLPGFEVDLARLFGVLHEA
jgi:Uma2 family endonuclease